MKNNSNSGEKINFGTALKDTCWNVQKTCKANDNSKNTGKDP